MKREVIRQAWGKTIPVMAGYLVLGMGFGILMKAKGYGMGLALLMSVFVYAGSLQYAAVSLFSSGANLWMAAMTAFMVNARHLFYGLSMLKRYRGAGWKKLYLMHALSDETYSLVCNGAPSNVTDPHAYYFYVSLFDQLYWVIGTLCGSLLGTIIPFDLAGIEFSMTALFVTVFVEQWLSVKEHRPAFIGLGVSALCLLLFGKDNFLLAAMVLICIWLCAIRKRLRQKEALK